MIGDVLHLLMRSFALVGLFTLLVALAGAVWARLKRTSTQEAKSPQAYSSLGRLLVTWLATAVGITAVIITNPFANRSRFLEDPISLGAAVASACVLLSSLVFLIPEVFRFARFTAKENARDLSKPERPPN